jgi:hypothetical protein
MALTPRVKSGLLLLMQSTGELTIPSRSPIAIGTYAKAFVGGRSLWRRTQRQRAVVHAECRGELKISV